MNIMELWKDCEKCVDWDLYNKSSKIGQIFIDILFTACFLIGLIYGILKGCVIALTELIKSYKERYDLWKNHRKRGS